VAFNSMAIFTEELSHQAEDAATAAMMPNNGRKLRGAPLGNNDKSMPFPGASP